MTWWCSARGLPWDWTWQAYPGVWIFAIAVGAVFWRASRDAPLPLPIWRRVAIPAGVVILWLSLDWPVGALGAGYLASVHSVQFLMLAMVVPPLLLLGLDRSHVADALHARPALQRLVAAVTKPLFAIVAFAVTMVLTHLPQIVDRLMATQIGAFALDAAWFGVGLLFWWPVVVRVPERRQFPPLMQMLYIFFGTQPHLYIAMWLLAADYPAYATYELAPRATSLSAITDQQVAGATMLGFGATYVLGVITVLFFKWARAESLQTQDAR